MREHVYIVMLDITVTTYYVTTYYVTHYKLCNNHVTMSQQVTTLYLWHYTTVATIIISTMSLYIYVTVRHMTNMFHNSDDYLLQHVIQSCANTRYYV